MSLRPSVLVLVVALGTAAALVLHRSVVPVRKAAHVVGTAALLLVPCIYKIVRSSLYLLSPRSTSC